MKTYTELVKESANVAQEIKTIEEWFTDSNTKVRALINAHELDEYKAMRKDMEAEEVEKSKRLELLKVAQKILKDNIRVAYFTETMPKVLEVMKKYEGKPIGEKTEAKMRGELKDIGVGFLYISREPEYRSDELRLFPIDAPYRFGPEDMTVLVHSEVGKKQPILGGNGGNRLIVYDLDQYYISWCGDYVDDYMFRASTILYKYRELKEQRERLETEYKSFNDLLPRSMDRLDISKHLYNSIA